MATYDAGVLYDSGIRYDESPSTPPMQHNQVSAALTPANLTTAIASIRTINCAPLV